MVAAEIFILFEVIAFVIFILAIESESPAYSGLAMGIFFALAGLSLSVERLFTGEAISVYIALGINFGLGLLCLVYTLVNAMGFLGGKGDGSL